jgi:hypothetical protein
LGYRGAEGLERLPEGTVELGLGKSRVVHYSFGVSILGWAAASNERALDNARAAAVECSRRRLERAEVAQAVAELTAAYAVPATASLDPVGGHDMSVRARAR